MLTIKDIAKLSGCAVSTVSRALNNHPDVSEETKQRIKQIVEDNRFVPNTNAKHLKQQISNNIVVIVKGLNNLFFASLIERIQTEISKAGYGVILHYVGEDANEVRVAEQLCKEYKPRGFIFLGGNTETFAKRFANINVPCVLTSTSAADLQFANLSSVSVDDEKGAQMAVNYLMDCGHRAIGVVGGSPALSCTTELRLIGCQKGFEARGLSFAPSRYRPSAYTLQAGYQETLALLAENPGLTAVFAFSDLIAFGAIRAIQDSGLRVPEDLSVIGFDGIELTEYFSPKLTTMKQPAGKLAEMSVKLLLKSIEKNAPPKHMLLEVELIQGASVKKL